MFIQDLDGFVIELSQAGAPRGGAARTPAPPAQPQGNIVGGGFELTIEDTTKTVDFYQKVLGFQLTAGTTFNNDKVMNDTAGVPGGAFKQSRGPIPGTTNATIVFIEFANVDRKAAEDSRSGSRHGDPAAECSRYGWLDEGTQGQRSKYHHDRRGTGQPRSREN